MVPYLFVFRSSWAWLGVSFFLLFFMLLRRLMFPASPLRAFRTAIVIAAWSCKMPLASTPAFLSLLDGPEGVDPAFHIILARFRMMRRYLAYCPEEEPRIFRMLDLISRCAQGHGPVHLLLTSAAEVGFALDGDERGWVRSSLPPLWMMSGTIQHFYSSILEAWRYRVSAKLAERRVFGQLRLLFFRRLFTTTELFPSEGKR